MKAPIGRTVQNKKFIMIISDNFYLDENTLWSNLKYLCQIWQSLNFSNLENVGDSWRENDAFWKVDHGNQCCLKWHFWQLLFWPEQCTVSLEITVILEFFESGKFWRLMEGEQCILVGWSWTSIFFKMTFLTTFISIIKLYNSIIKLFSILGEKIKKILGFSHFFVIFAKFTWFFTVPEKLWRYRKKSFHLVCKHARFWSF